MKEAFFVWNTSELGLHNSESTSVIVSNPMKMYKGNDHYVKHKDLLI